METIIALSAQAYAHDDKFSLKYAYTDALLSAGAAPFVCAPVPDRAYLEAIVSNVDGVMLTGGDDVAPELYGDIQTSRCKAVCRFRDEFEIALVKLCAMRGIPTLGICRGIQVMNVAFGGSLYQDINGHMQNAPKSEGCHEVRVTDMLARIYPEAASVNSFHHQAIKRVAPSFTVCARSDDGYVEGICQRYADFFIGVQWHPEHMVNSDKSARMLFEEFVHACERYRKRRK